MSKEKSQFIGVLLLSLLAVTYFQYFGTKKTQYDQQTVATHTSVTTPSLKKLAPPSLSAAMCSDEDLLLENEDIRLWVSPKGGGIKRVILKKYKDNDNTPLKLLEATKNHMTWLLSSQNNTLNTQHLDFSVTKHHNQLILLCSLKEGTQHIKYTYTLPEKGYTLNCKLHTTGFDTTPRNLQLRWYYAPQNPDKDFSLNKRNTYAQYHTASKGVSYTTANKEISINDIKWIGIKQRFFTAAVIAPQQQSFTHGDIITRAPQKDDHSTLIETSMKVELPLHNADYNECDLTFYFGPNNSAALAQVGFGFEKNQYLGFSPIRQLNTYIIAPLASFFDDHTPHYVWVLLLLALFFKLLQLYFLYKDYIITLKQKALQPAVQELKAKYQNKQEAQLAEMHFYTSMGLPRVPFFIKLFIAIFEIPIFMCMVYFIPQNIALRHVSFLWSNDLSASDHFIDLPFYIPLLGDHISLFALLMCISFLLRSSKNTPQESTSNARFFKYITPITMFLIFNNNAAAFCLYRIFENLLGVIPNFFFKLFVNEKFHIAQLRKKDPEASPTSSKELPRTLARLEKKRKK